MNAGNDKVEGRCVSAPGSTMTVGRFGNGRILGGQLCDSRTFEYGQVPSILDISPLMNARKRIGYFSDF